MLPASSERVPVKGGKISKPVEAAVEQSESVAREAYLQRSVDAVQYAMGYGPVRIRSAIIPVTQFGSQFAFVALMLGMVMYSQPLFLIGIALFSLTTLFQLVTLPVEFDASGRALRILGDSGILYEDEVKQTRKVLGAAAMTYVAAAAASILSLLRLLILLGGRNRD